MLKIAGVRLPPNRKLTLLKGNMLNLSQAGKYDFVTCYSDSICYIRDEVGVGMSSKRFIMH